MELPGYESPLANCRTVVGLIHTAHFFPMAKATRVVVLRVRKYLPPGLQVEAQESFSYRKVSHDRTLWGSSGYLDFLEAGFLQSTLGRSDGMEG
jgi:hypothetical protein